MRQALQSCSWNKLALWKVYFPEEVESTVLDLTSQQRFRDGQGIGQHISIRYFDVQVASCLWSNSNSTCRMRRPWFVTDKDGWSCVAFAVKVVSLTARTCGFSEITLCRLLVGTVALGSCRLTPFFLFRHVMQPFERPGTLTMASRELQQG